MESTAMATVAESPETESRITVRPTWTPDTFRAQVEQEKQMRSIMASYMKEAMTEGHHYYTFKEGDKPAISQEGAHAICSLLKCTIGPPEIEKRFYGDHLTVEARVHIYNQDNVQVATGDGICSTREPKYAYRWAWENEIPDGVDVSKLASKSGTARNGKPWTQYKVPNQDLPELWNTILKMGVKRAKVAAVRQLPLVSELFAAEPEGDDHNEPPKPKAARQPQQKTSAAASSGSRNAEPPASVANAIRIAGKLRDDFDTDDEDIVLLLPEGVARVEDLTPEQAEDVIPALSQLLNSKIAAAKG